MNLRIYNAMYEHHCWATDRVLGAATKLSIEQFTANTSESNYGSLRGTLVHILDAEESYRSRLETGINPEDIPESDFPTAAPLATRFKEEQARMRAYLATLKDEDLEGIAIYQAGGMERRRPRWHVLSQLFNHGTAHRAEAAVILTMLGQSPGDLDFVVWVDETQGK